MTPIEKNDLVELKRDVSHELSEGLVGMVLQSDSDGVKVAFPLPGNNVYAQLPREDVKFLVAVNPPED
ncbi:hypothetical protein F7734_45345 [Scytonema sp. UIC 10036]|uniref:hypothetical protein n=1 Tax=Scytonema sp. UIC 10036 TaxID=2304196 RepID=UPI0012DA5A21|nr:hypothetical protein [Scytonema sp. UIC 10036]MUG99137.1 hypothetical protein [Scytonema sp. UIC 10036]